MSATMLKTIADVRKAINPLGFNVRVKSYSFGQAASYFCLDDKTKSSPGNVFTSITLEKWSPLFNWQRANEANLKQLTKETGITSLALTTP